MVHGSVPHVMTAGKRRDDDVRNAEPQLRAKALISSGGSVSRMRARTAGTQVAMVGVNARCRRLAGQETVRVHRDGRDIAFQSGQSSAGVLVGMAGDWRHVIIRASAFIEGEEQG